MVVYVHLCYVKASYVFVVNSLYAIAAYGKLVYHDLLRSKSD